MKDFDLFPTLFLLFVLTALIGGGYLINKDITAQHIDKHMERGANFYQAYCAVHEPRTLQKCVNSLLNQ